MGSGLLDQQFERIEAIKRQLDDQALKIIAELQDKIVELNTKDQLFKGLDAKGQKLSPKYSRVRYARAKNSANPLPGLGTPDLKLTGKFYSDFFVTAKNGEFELFSSDDKADGLEAKYGEDIFGLSLDNEGKINKQITEELFKWILSKM